MIRPEFYIFRKTLKINLSLVFGFLVLLSFVVVGCAFDLAHVSYRPTSFSPRAEIQNILTMQENVPLSQAPCGYSRTLRQGSHWEFVGRIPEGLIFKPQDQVLTVECSNIHEAYIVVIDSLMVGFYLPVEKGFVPIEKKIDLPLK